MPDLIAMRRSPLSYLAGELDACSSRCTGVRIEELHLSALVNLRGDVELPLLAAGMRQALGLDLATLPNTFTRSANLRCLWLGPDEWLIASESIEAGEIMVRLAPGLSGGHFSAVDVSAAYAALQISGGRAYDVLAMSCPLDLHPRVFRPGQCAQSNLARTQGIVALESDAPVFRLLVKRSNCEYLAQWLLDAIEEFRA